jgi:hypothetical protein
VENSFVVLDAVLADVAEALWAPADPWSFSGTGNGSAPRENLLKAHDWLFITIR